jgi:hypothetical protein
MAGNVFRPAVLSSGNDNRPNQNLGSDGGGGGMEPRIAKLEADSEYIKRDVGELRMDMKDVRDRVIKIENTMATKSFVFAVYGIVSALLAAIMLFQSQIQSLLGLVTKTG